MRDDDPLKRTITDWEQKFTNRWYLQPRGHGDVSQMGREVWGWQFKLPTESARVQVYANMVSAVLLRWDEIKRVASEPYFSNPIYLVAKMAIQQIGPDSPKVVYDGLQEQFDRLWTESPRPHDDELRFLALSFGEYFPISRAQLGVLFSQPGWSVVCFEIASKKGWTNDAIEMIQELRDGKVELSATTIESLPELGYSLRSALKWMRLLHPDNDFAQMVCESWEQDLMTQGMTLEEIYAHDA